MSIETLKEQARGHEQKEEWQKALDLYLQAIEKLDEAEEPDISLYNRVGDLEVRLGRVDRAVEYYEEAVDLYNESELPNNAIAICKKVIRNVPGRHSIYLRMGQIRAAQGFLTDARQNFLVYAEQKQAEGDIEAALDALIDFVALAPEDIEIRVALAEQLEQHGRSEEALTQYREAHRRLVREGREEEAAEVERSLESLAPGIELDGVGVEEEREPEPTGIGSPGGEWGGGFQEIDLEGAGVGGEEAGPDPGAGEPRGEEEVEEEVPEGEEEAFEVEVGGLELFDMDAPGGEEYEAEGAGESSELGEPSELGESSEVGEPSERGEPSEVGEPSEDVRELPEEEASAAEESFEEATEEDVGDLEGLEVGGLDEEEWEEEEIDLPPLPTFGYDEEPPGEGGEAEGSERMESEEDEEELPPLPLLGFEGDEDGHVADEVHEDEIGEIDERELGAPEEAFDAREQAFEEAAGGEDSAPPSHEELAEAGHLEEAIAALEEEIAIRPGDVELRKRMVEYAFRSRRDDVLVPAYLGLAAALLREGSEGRARAVYEQVLETDPDNVEARRALQEEDVEVPPPSPSPEAPSSETSSEEYVDLGSLILEEEEEKSTRFVVPAETPSGDEEADFARMLDQFKEKVAANVSADDVAAHYDLGTAYKEMGLVEEAIGEFQAALRARRDHLPTYELLGQCFLEQEQYEVAARTLRRALDVPYSVDDERVGIYYYLGRAYEELGDRPSARDFYEKVFELDINFRDVTERLRSLR